MGVDKFHAVFDIQIKRMCSDLGAEFNEPRRYTIRATIDQVNAIKESLPWISYARCEDCINLEQVYLENSEIDEDLVKNFIFDETKKNPALNTKSSVFVIEDCFRAYAIGSLFGSKPTGLENVLYLYKEAGEEIPQKVAEALEMLKPQSKVEKLTLYFCSCEQKVKTFQHVRSFLSYFFSSFELFLAL